MNASNNRSIFSRGTFKQALIQLGTRRRGQDKAPSKSPRRAKIYGGLILLTAGALGATSVSQAAALCIAPGKVVKFRPVACKKREKPIDPIALGLQGPQGIQGPPGPSIAPVPADQRFSVMWQVSGGVHHVAVRGDASIRDTDDNSVVVTKVDVGRYCIKAPALSRGPSECFRTRAARTAPSWFPWASAVSATAWQAPTSRSKPSVSELGIA